MSEVDDRYVNRGFWLNVEQGTILGRTLTVDSRTGTIIVALLAVMASLATTHLWNIVAFSYHQFRASGGPRDAFFQQQQVLLRTLAPPGSFIADCVKLWWLWRKRQNHAFKRSIAQVIVAMTFVATTIAVGVFSSYVASSTNLQILVHNPQCRPLDLDPTLDTFMQHQLNLSAYEIDVTSRSKPFAEECYQNKTSLSARCMAFIQPNIPLEAERTDCPFDTKVCAAEDLGVSVDSGLVDGNHIFGWNMHAGDRVKFRRKVTCGILRQEGYTEIINASDWPDLGRSPIPGETLEIARYGSKRKTSLGDNITFVNSLVKVNLTTKYSTAIRKSWLKEELHWLDNVNVLPEMESNNSDLVLVGISANSLTYDQPVNDPFFSAHRAEVRYYSNQNNETVYLADRNSAVMGCQERYQFCATPSKGPDICTKLDALPGRIRQEDFPGASEIQIAALQLLMRSSLEFNTFDGVYSGTEVERLMGEGRKEGLPGLPDDQWMREVVAWEKFVWASLQTVTSDYAVGHATRDPSVLDHIRNETTLGERQLCGIQRMRKSGGFMNINVFGLSFAITFSCVVIIVDLVLLKFLIYLSGFRRALAPRIDRWIQDGVFQLQRRSYESKEGMEWKYIDHEIPIPENDGPLEELDVKTSRGPGIHGCTKCSGNGDYGGSLGKFDSLQDDSVEFKANLDESKGLNDERRDFANSHTGSTSKND